MTQTGEFIWDGSLWKVKLNFPDWQGYTLQQTMDYPLTYASEGLVLSLDNGDSNTPPSGRHYEYLKWLQAHQAGIQNAMLRALFNQYPDFKAEALEWHEEDHQPRLSVILPEIKDIEALKRLVCPRRLMLIRESEALAKPLFAIDVDCSWDEQGLGVLIYGEKVLEAAEKDMIFDSYELEAHVQDILNS